jgi:hypothetical protein
VVSELRKQKFITETVRMISAAKENEHAVRFRVSMDHYSVAQGEIGHDRGMKFCTVGFDGGVNGVENLDVENRTLGQGVEGISARGAKAGLQVKSEN